LDKALSQIRARRYYEKYQDANKEIVLLAIAFTGKEIKCRMEELNQF
jgi:hypothetical protein